VEGGGGLDFFSREKRGEFDTCVYTNSSYLQPKFIISYQSIMYIIISYDEYKIRSSNLKYSLATGGQYQGEISKQNFDII